MTGPGTVGTADCSADQGWLTWPGHQRVGMFSRTTHTPVLVFISQVSFCRRNNNTIQRGNSAVHLSEVIERWPCPPCPMSRKAGGPSEGGGPQSADAERESVLRFWLRRTVGSLSAGLVSLSEGRMLLPLSPLSLSSLQLFSGTQIFNYLLLLDLSHGSPGCVWKHLPL